MNIKKEHKTLFLIFILAVLLRIIFFDVSYFIWDETVYMMNSEFIATGTAPYVQLYERPLLLSLMILPFIKSQIMLRLFMILINSSAVFGIYFLGSNFGKKTGLIASFLLAIFPFHIMTSKWVMTDTLSFLFITLTIAFYINGIKKNKLSKYVWGGICLSLSLLLKFTNILLCVLLIVLFIVLKSKISIRKTLYSLFISFLIFLPYLIFNKAYFGNPFYPIIQATHVVFENQPISTILVSGQIILFFGLLLVTAILGIKKKKLSTYLVLWFAFTIIYFIILSQKGICKPEGIEWEIQRFLFPALAPILILSASFLSKLSKKALYVSCMLIMLAFIPAYTLTYTPMIEFEDGLREVSKDIGIYINENIPEDANIYAKENFPVIAYYSNRLTSNNIEDLDTDKLYHIKIEKEYKKEEKEIYHIKIKGYTAKLISLS